MKENRRNFIRKLTALGSTGILAQAPATSAVSSQADQSAARRSFKLSVFQTTDIHCQLHEHDELFWEDGKAIFRKTGGYAQIAAYLNEQRRLNPNCFVIDTGDMFQGSEVSVKTTGQALVPILNKLNYNLFLPGNWEVVYGKRSMQSLLGSLNAPTVCANMYHDTGNGVKGELIFPPYYVWNIRGIKIGFLGYTDPLVPLRQSPAYSKGIIYSKPEETLAQYVDKLRNEENCAYVLILSHLGLSQQIHLSNLPECKGVDYILGGDTHERIRVPIQGKYAKIVEPGAFGSFVGKLELTIRDGRVIDDNYELVEMRSGMHPPSADVEQLVKQVELPYKADVHEIIGYSTLPLYRYFVIENTIDTLILQALKWKQPEIDIVLSNGFRFCPPKSSPDHTGRIPITNGFLYDMLPVDSIVRTAEVTGLQLKQWLETELNNVFAKDASQRLGGWMVKFKGMKVEFYAFRNRGERVSSILIGGKPVEDSSVYKVSACEREGDPVDTLCRIRGVRHPVNTKFTMHSVLKEYLAAHSPVSPNVEASAKALDAPPTLLSQVWGVDYTFR